MCNNCIKGCGKTTLAKKLAKTWKCELVNGTLNRNARGGPVGEKQKKVAQILASTFQIPQKIQHKQTAGKKFYAS
jgi:cytidylate kinase